MFKIVLCGEIHQDSNKIISINHPPIDKKLTFKFFPLPHSTILNISRGVTASGLGHLLGNESMPNNAYTKNTEDDFLG